MTENNEVCVCCILFVFRTSATDRRAKHFYMTDSIARNVFLMCNCVLCYGLRACRSRVAHARAFINIPTLYVPQIIRFTFINTRLIVTSTSSLSVRRMREMATHSSDNDTWVEFSSVVCGGAVRIQSKHTITRPTSTIPNASSNCPSAC